MASILVNSTVDSAEIPVAPGIGVVTPYDFALDREIWRWLPDDVSLYVTRTPRLRTPVTIEMAEQVGEPAMVAEATDDVLTVEPGVVVYLCTSGSFVRGLAGERDLAEAIRGAGAEQAITTSGALLDAIGHLGLSRLAIATPYVASVTDRLADFLAEAGIRVVASAHLGLQHRIWQVPYRDVTELISAADTPDAEAVFVSCTNLVTFDVIAEAEQRLGKPVLTANQVTIWAALGALGATSPVTDQLLFARPGPAEGGRSVDEQG